MTAKELALAQRAWEQARDRAGYEHMAWSLLLNSRKELIASCRSAGMTAQKAHAEFEKHMEGHRKRYGDALENLAKTAKELGALLRKKRRRQ